MARTSISKKTRFEVFKRDSFRCQYCGRSAPDVVLEVDHVHPVSKGGANDILNLITSCWACNAGKSDRELSDNSTLQKQRAQLEELNEKRAQLEMMIEWRDGLKALDDQKVAAAIQRWESAIVGWRVNEQGEREFKARVRKYPIDILLDSIDEAAERLRIGNDGKATEESVALASGLISTIAGMRLADRKHPGARRAHYIRGILRNQFTMSWDEQASALQALLDAAAAGVDMDDVQALAQRSTCLYGFSDQLAELVLRKGSR